MRLKELFDDVISENDDIITQTFEHASKEIMVHKKSLR